MKIELPLETWADVFGFLTRPRRAEIVSNIGDRQFASFIQFSLHKCGDITLGQQHLQIISQNRDNGPAIVEKDWEFEFPLADGPMPANIKNFNTVIISYFDESVLAFLKEFERQSLFSYVNLKIFSLPKECSHVLLEIMNNVLPLFNSIETIDIGRDMRDLLQDHYSEHEQYKRVLKSARAIETGNDSIVDNDWFCNWLHIPREDGKPRYLSAVMKDCNTHSIIPFIEHVKKEFMGAKEPVSFFVTILIRWLNDDEDGDGDIQTFTLENLQTNEKLVINEGRRLEISRYPIGASENLEEEIEKDWKYEDRTVKIYITKWKPNLPTENWNDIFGSVPRPQLAEIVPQIGDWYFATKAQYYLHECGQITLGPLEIISSINGHGAVIPKGFCFGPEFPLADAPMPENVKNFNIWISHYDESVQRFLQQFHRSSLFENANLHFSQCDSAAVSSFMRYILPFFTNINSIFIGVKILSLFQNEYSELAMPKLTSARVLDTSCNLEEQVHCDFFRRWLHIPTESGKSRLLRLYQQDKTPNDIQLISSFIEQIKKDFLESKQAGVCYFIHIHHFYRLNDQVRTLESLILDNSQTNEKLVIKNTSQGIVSILRHPIGANVKWIEEMSRWPNSDYRKIVFRI